MEEIKTIFSLFFPLPPTEPIFLGKRMVASSILGWGWYFLTAAKTPIILQDPHPWQGDGHEWGQPGLSAASWSQQTQMRSSTACCWQTQQPKLYVRTHYIFSSCFSTWCLPAGGLQVMARERAEGFQKLFVYFWRHGDEQREWGKAKAKTNVQSLAWLVQKYLAIIHRMVLWTNIFPS